MCQTIRDGGLSAAGRRRHAPEHRVLAKLWVTQLYAYIYIYMLPPPPGPTSKPPATLP